MAMRASGGAGLIEWAYLIVITTLVQAALIGGLLILLPLSLMKRTWTGGVRFGAYFLALGLAFLFVEIAFIQKFTLFLSHPLYAVAVVLASFLVFAGAGSACSLRLARQAAARELTMGEAVATALENNPSVHAARERAEAVVGDLVDLARELSAGQSCRVPLLGVAPEHVRDLPVVAMEDVETPWYLRMEAEDKPGVMSQVATIFSDEGISIEALIQKAPREGETRVPVVVLTNTARQGRVDAAVAAALTLGVVSNQLSGIGGCCFILIRLPNGQFVPKNLQALNW